MSRPPVTRDTGSAALGGFGLVGPLGVGFPEGSFIARSQLVLWVKTQVESDCDLGQMAVLT